MPQPRPSTPRPSTPRPSTPRAPDARPRKRAASREGARSGARSSVRPAAPSAPRGRARKLTDGSEKPRLDPNDAGVRRRAAKRNRRRAINLLAWGVLAGATVFVIGAGTGVWAEYKRVQQKIGVKEATLSDLRAQLGRKQRRVAAQNTREGKERALVEGGYLGPGERFLLFPKGKDKKKD